MIFFFLLVFFLNLYIFLNYEYFSKLINLYDNPDNQRKFHNKKTPSIGGFLVIINLLFFYIFKLTLIDLPEDYNLYVNFFSFFIITLIIFILGYLDDKYNLSPNYKLFFLGVLFFTSISFDKELLINHLYFKTFLTDINLGRWSYLFTCLCFLLFLNAMNMFDGVNVQSASFYFLIFSIFFFKNIFLIFALLILVMLFFYIILNFKSKIFFGSNGIFVLSYIVGYILIKSYNLSRLSVEEILVLLLYPGLDMFRLFIERILKKKHPFYPDRNHIHHLIYNRFKNNNLTIFFSILLFSIPIIIFYLFNINFLIIIITIIFTYISSFVFFRSFRNK